MHICVCAIHVQTGALLKHRLICPLPHGTTLTYSVFTVVVSVYAGKSLSLYSLQNYSTRCAVLSLMSCSITKAIDAL